jgi:redox-sensing transcriptional repressor
MSMQKKKLANAPSIRRFPSYLHVIQRHLGEKRRDYLSATVIARELDLEAIQVRKDLSITGIAGTPKRGYPSRELAAAIERFLGWDTVNRSVLVGAGNLGSALLGYRDFKEHGLDFVAAFDSDPRKTSAFVHGVPVFDIADLETALPSLNARVAVLTIPSECAQSVADRLVSCGIEALWNFTHAKLDLPGHVRVQKEDLSSGYAMLSVMMRGSRKT